MRVFESENENFQLKQIMNVKAGWILFNYEIHILETKNDFLQKNKIDNLKSITLILKHFYCVLKLEIRFLIFDSFLVRAFASVKLLHRLIN